MYTVGCWCEILQKYLYHILFFCIMSILIGRDVRIRLLGLYDAAQTTRYIAAGQRQAQIVLAVSG